MMEHKALPITDFTVLNAAEGIVECIVSVTGIKDRVDDIIMPGAYTKTLQARTPKGVYSHDWDKPIAKTLSIRELPPGHKDLPVVFRGEPWPAEAGALMVKAQFNLKTERGRDAYEDVVFYGDEQEWCVDEETEILTERGWLYHDELTTDDRAYVLDMDTLTARFDEVQAVNVWPAKTRRMRHIETGGFSSLTTAAHRWPVRFQDGHVGWRTTETLTNSNAIFRTAPRSDAPTEAKWSDAFVELVAWYWTEGWVERSNISIGQSQTKNAAHVAAIRQSLTDAFPGQFTEQAERANGMIHFRLTKVAADLVHSVTGAHKAPTPEFLLSLTKAQLELFVNRCMDGDGHTVVTGQRTWYQVKGHSVRMFEMACTLAGIATATNRQLDYGNRFGAPPTRIALLKSAVARPLDAIRVKTLNGRPSRTPAINAWVAHDGIVWCPTTPTGTWLARRHGKVYFTGNSIGYNVPVGGSKTTGGVRYIKVMDLFEFSPVLFGAMPLAGTLSVKSAQQAWAAVKDIIGGQDGPTFATPEGFGGRQMGGPFNVCDQHGDQPGEVRAKCMAMKVCALRTGDAPMATEEKKSLLTQDELADWADLRASLSR